MQEAIVLEFPLREAEFETAGEASSQIKQALAQLGIPAHINRRIVTSVYEAAMNVVIHAYRGVIQAKIFSDHTEVLVLDEGPGIADIDLAMQLGYSTATEEIQALGFGAGAGMVNIFRIPEPHRKILPKNPYNSLLLFPIIFDLLCLHYISVVITL